LAATVVDKLLGDDEGVVDAELLSLCIKYGTKFKLD